MFIFHLLTIVLAVAVAAWSEGQGALRRSLHPPGLADPLRHMVASGAIAMVLWLAVFEPLALVGREQPEVDLQSLPVSSLFIVQGMLLVAVLIWWLAGWLGARAEEPSTSQSVDVSQHLDDSQRLDEVAPATAEAPVTGRDRRPWLACLGLDAAHPVRELMLGLGAGFVAWGGVLAAVITLAALAALLGADAWVSEPPSEIIVWMVELGIGTRLLISLSAGVTEELFFRGYLQPRIGLWASTACFVAAHAGYGRPFMLVGVCLLSLLYGLLTRWRGSIWAAISAHFLFDAVQLLVVIPAALQAAQASP